MSTIDNTPDNPGADAPDETPTPIAENDLPVAPEEPERKEEDDKQSE